MTRQLVTIVPEQPVQRSSHAAPDDLCVWCGEPVGDEVCFNSKDICIDCCVEAGDPCGH